jgi:hypothetical protein
MVVIISTTTRIHCPLQALITNVYSMDRLSTSTNNRKNICKLFEEFPWIDRNLVFIINPPSVFSVPDSKNHCSEVSTMALAISLKFGLN